MLILIPLRGVAAIAATACVSAAIAEAPAAPDEPARRELEQRGGRRLVFKVDRGEKPGPFDEAARARLAAIVARRFEDVTGHAVIVRAAGEVLTVEVPRSAADELSRLDRELGETESLGAIVRPGHVEFAVVDDRDETLAKLAASLPRGIELARDRVASAAGVFTPPYLRARDRGRLEDFVERRAPERRTFRIQRLAASGFRTILLERPALDGASIVDARADRNTSGEISLLIRFDDRGAALLARLTSENVGRRLAMVLDGTVDSAPLVEQPIRSGSIRLHFGSATTPGVGLLEAQQLAIGLRSGALPGRLWIMDDRFVAPKQP